MHMGREPHEVFGAATVGHLPVKSRPNTLPMANDAGIQQAEKNGKKPLTGYFCPLTTGGLIRVRGFGGCAATHVEGTGTAHAVLAMLAVETVGCRDRPRIGAACPFGRLVSGVGDPSTGDRPRPEPVWETARVPVTLAPTAGLRLLPTLGGCHDTPQRLVP